MARKKGLTFYEKEKKISRSMIREIFSTIFCAFAAVLVAFVLVFSVGMQVGVIGVSMEPKLHNGQEVLVNTNNSTGNLMAGEQVRIVFNGVMTASIPPQLNAQSICVLRVY